MFRKFLGLTFVALVFLSSYRAHAAVNFLDLISVKSAFGDCLTNLSLAVLWDYEVTQTEHVAFKIVDATGTVLLSSSPTLRTTDPTPYSYFIFGDLQNLPNQLPLTIVVSYHGSELDRLTFDPRDFGVCLTIPDSISDSSYSQAVPFAFKDGRINRFDVAASAVIYPYEIDGKTGYEVYSSKGKLLFVINPQDIGECPSENLLLASNKAAGVYFYQLVSCEFQLIAPQNNGKSYIVIFNAERVYRSYEE